MAGSSIRVEASGNLQIEAHSATLAVTAISSFNLAASMRVDFAV